LTFGIEVILSGFTDMRKPPYHCIKTENQKAKMQYTYSPIQDLNSGQHSVFMPLLRRVGFSIFSNLDTAATPGSVPSGKREAELRSF
jgi:hypothetical protein